MASQSQTVPLQEKAPVLTAVLAVVSLLILYAPFSPSLDGVFRRFPAQKVVKALEDDPFTVAKEDDFKDGIPFHGSQDIQSFWTKIAQRKTVVVLLQITIIATWIQSLLSACTSLYCDGESSPLSKGIFIFLAGSILTISGLSVLDRDDKQQHHAHSINHLSFLLTVKIALMGTLALLPVPTTLVVFKELFIRLNGWNIDLFCTFLSWLIVITTPLGPAMNYPPEKIYSSKTLNSLGAFPENNLSEENTTSLLGKLFFSYSGKVFMLGRAKALATLNQLPILPARLRASVNLSEIKYTIRHVSNPFARFMHPESSFQLAYQLLRTNLSMITKLQIISFTAAVMFYVPIAMIQQFLRYLENDPLRQDTSWGWFYVIGIFVSQYVLVIINAQLWSVSSNDLRPRIGLQLNTLIYSKTLVRKDVPSVNSTMALLDNKKDAESPDTNFSSKAEVMTLMTTDVGRAGDLARLCFSLTDCTIGIAIGTYMLYYLLGSSAFVGLAVAICLVPLNQVAGKAVVSYQQNVMQCRSERVALTNELLGAIRMIKFMAWERSFEKRVLNVRTKELRYQKRIFILETLWNSLGESIPLFFAVACFWHFSVIRREELTPAIAFTAIIIFTEIKFALTELPAFFVQVVQSFVSLGRIAKYIHLPEVKLITTSDTLLQSSIVGCSSATISWPQTRSPVSGASSVARNTFSLTDISTVFPPGQLSLVFGKTGAGKTLLLLSLLGEAEVLSGKVMCPRSAVNSFELLQQFDGAGEWLLEGICAYVPQASWLRNQTIKENILFNLPFNATRYKAVLEACALNYDLAILEDGDEAEIGEQGINLSGGQKARISLARAVYSRASILLLDDVLSSVDAHTANHLWQRCFKGGLMQNRTVILVSHHLQLCGPDAGHVLALEQGRVRHSGTWASFQGSAAMQSIVTSIKSSDNTVIASPDSTNLSSLPDYSHDTVSGTTQSAESDHVHASNVAQPERRKVVQEEESRQEGRISKDVWLLYIHSTGGFWFWLLLSIVILLSAFSPLWEKGWLKIWSAADDQQRVVFYMGTYSAIVLFEIVAGITRWVVLYDGSIRASKVLHEKLLETVLFASLRFHDTISRGRLLNRFGKDFEGVDNNLPNELGRTVIIGISLVITMSSLVFIAGQNFLLLSLIIMATALYIAQAYGHVARDLRRLSSITSSPLFSVYGETISGLIVIRAFGMPTKFLRDMITSADTNMNPTYWSTGLHRWFSVRFQVAATFLLGLMALTILLHPSIDASWAGLALTFASTLTIEMYWFVRRWIDAEQVMVALERIKEYSVTIPAEAPEFAEPRPPAAWPTSGGIQCENLSIKYAPELPDVLKNLNFEIKPGEKIGLIGRTGSGKSTLGLSLMRFIEPTTGRILIDGLDIAKIGLTDLRSRVSIIPQDPILLSGTIRSSLDVMGEYDDAEIYDVLRRVNLLSSTESSVESEVHHVFSNLESPVSELGENFSAGERQLLCMARALLRRAKILIMDEATASVDYATDEVISKTIREAFVDSTILTIAHRLRTIVDYDRVMVMDQGNIVEFDSPRVLMNQDRSVFHGLCRAAGEEEFSKLKKMAQSSNQ